MLLSVIIPTFNEIKRLPKTLSKVVDYMEKNGVDGEIIISDGGSKDGTETFAAQFPSRIPIKVLHSPRRMGKGWGVKTGILESHGEWVIFMDADNSTDISEIKRFAPFQEEYDVIIGSRYAGIKVDVEQSILRRVVSRFGNLAIRIIAGLNFRDTQCGFKMFKRDVAKKIFSNLKTNGWAFDVEVLLLAKKFGFKIGEVAVKWRDAEGSHLRSGKDSWRAFLEVIKIKKRVRRLKITP